MSTQLIKKVRQLRTLLQRRTLEKGRIIVKNMSDKWLFAFDYSIEPEDGLVMTFFATEEEFAALQTVSHYQMETIHSYEDFIDLKGLRKGLQISFVPYTELPVSQQLTFVDEIRQPGARRMKVPQFLSFNHEGNLEEDFSKKERQFVEQCLNRLLLKNNSRVILDVLKKWTDESMIPVFRFNQLSGLMIYEQEETPLVTMADIPEWKAYVMPYPDVWHVPELTAFRYQKQIQSLLPEDFEIQLSVSPMQYFEEFSKGSPKYCLKIACRGELIGLKMMPKVSAATIQEAILLLLSSQQLYPRRFITRGVYAQRLVNSLDAVLKMLNVPIEIVDTLPTLDALDYETLMKELMDKVQKKPV